jgi:hypothetical protein
MNVRLLAKKLPVVRAAWYGLKKWRAETGRPPADVFTAIYRRNGFNGDESVSGPGSSLKGARVIAERLPGLLREFNVRTLLDIPCGDFNWMRRVPLGDVRYTGADIVEELVKRNKEFESENVRFVRLDLLADPLPQSDLVLVRDCLIHLSYRDTLKALENVRRSKSRYLLTTTYPEHAFNHDIATGGCRAVNLALPPFGLPVPLLLIHEEYSEGGGPVSDKSLGLWEVSGM